MPSFTSLRRRRWLAAVAVVAALSVAVAAAYAENVGPSLSFTPNSEKQVTNIDILRQQLKNYYGAPAAKTGPTGTWADPLNLQSNYANEASSVAKDGGNWLAARSHTQQKAIVLDVDDTTLTTWNYELFSNWDFNPATNGTFVTEERFPATPGMVEMVNRAADLGYAVFFLTGRPQSQYDATLGNLTPSDAIGVNAGYPTPTLIDLDGPNGAGGEQPGLFTKPPIGGYPDYLDTSEFCGPSIHATPPVSCPTIQYKSGVRAYIESQGYEIVGNFGDQFSDLEGGFADKTFKLPNPNYFLP